MQLSPDPALVPGERVRHAYPSASAPRVPERPSAAAPEDEPDDAEGQGEGEEDGPERMSRDPQAVGERLRETAEREAQAAEAESEPPAHPPDDPYTRACPTCKGWGETLTGSLVEGHVSRQCQDCKGWGYQVRFDVPADDAAQPAGYEAPTSDVPGADFWRTPGPG